MAGPFAPRHVVLNDRLLPAAEARISQFDRGLLFGDGVFETMRTYGGRVFRLERHLDRLRQSMAAIEIELAIDPARLRIQMAELLAAEGLPEARLRLTVTGGEFDGQIRLRRTQPPAVLMFATPLVVPSPEEYERGISLVVSAFHQPWSSPLARIKTNHRLEYLIAREDALRRGAQDALLLDDRGGVCESTSSNLFLVVNGALVTPFLSSPILPGVTRDAVLEVARRMGVPVEERFVPEAMLWEAEELFATATSWEVLAVSRVDARVIGGGARGTVTGRIHAGFRDLVQAGLSAASPPGLE